MLFLNKVNELAKIVRCNCSICKRKNATMGMVKNEDFKVTKGADKLKLYQYHTKVANHYFCTECGIYTHHNPRSAPAMTGFNLGCIDEVNVDDLKDELLDVVRKFQKRVGTTYPIALDPGSKHFTKFAHKNSGVTRNIVIDRDGKIAFLTRLFDKVEFQQMIDVIERLMNNKN